VQAIRHRSRDSPAYFLRLHPLLFVAVDDHARLQEHGGRSRGLEHDEVVVVVHAVPAVRKRLVLPRDRIGVIERGRETGVAQRLSHGRGAGEAARERAVLAGNEKGKARIAVAEQPLHAVEFPGLEEMRLHRIVVHGEKKIRAGRGDGALREPGRETVRADEQGSQSPAAHGGFDFRRELAVEIQLRTPARAGGARFLDKVSDVDGDGRRMGEGHGAQQHRKQCTHRAIVYNDAQPDSRADRCVSRAQKLTFPPTTSRSP
jgi:hypothetical protein